MDQIKSLKSNRTMWTNFFDKYKSKINSIKNSENSISSLKISNGALVEENCHDMSSSEDEIYASTEADFTNMDSAVQSLFENKSCKLDEGALRCLLNNPGVSDSQSRSRVREKNNSEIENSDQSFHSNHSSDFYDDVSGGESELESGETTDSCGSSRSVANSNINEDCANETRNVENSVEQSLEAPLNSSTKLKDQSDEWRPLRMLMGFTSESNPSHVYLQDHNISSTISSSKTQEKVHKRFTLVKIPNAIRPY